MEPAIFKEDVIKVPLNSLMCSNCKSYLTSSPIFSTTAGKLLCSDCPQACKDDIGSYRMVQLEEALKECDFPCRFKSHGCQEHITFDIVKQHEKQCDYRTMPCPVSTILGGNCSWQGKASDIRTHFLAEHTELVHDEMKLVLEVEKDAEYCLLIQVHEVGFIFWCKYNASKKTLSYAFVPTTSKISSGSYRLRMLSITDLELSITLKQYDFERICYDDGYFQNPVVLNITSHLAVLNDPLAIILKVNIFDVNWKYLVKDIVNEHLEEKLKCGKCHQLMYPPIFKNSNLSICKSCKDEIWQRDFALEQTCSKISYRCNHTGCPFVGNHRTIEEHLNDCLFLNYSCVLPGCNNKKFPSSDRLNQHYIDKHNVTMLKTGTTCIYNTLSYEDVQPKIFSFLENIYNRQITLQYSRVSPNFHYWYLHYAGSNLLFFIRLEHESCGAKSDKYPFINIREHRFEFTLNTNDVLAMPILAQKCCRMAKFCITFKKTTVSN